MLDLKDSRGRGESTGMVLLAGRAGVAGEGSVLIGSAGKGTLAATKASLSLSISSRCLMMVLSNDALRARNDLTSNQMRSVQLTDTNPVQDLPDAGPSLPDPAASYNATSGQPHCCVLA